MRSTSKSLLHRIAACPYVTSCLNSAVQHPCRTIVESQKRTTTTDFHVPEPWSGHIERAPLLFVSSNPSIDELEFYPTMASIQEELADFFVHRFGGGRREWVRDGLYPLHRDGTFRPEWVRFWASVRARARELLGPSVVEGRDYVMTEIVHCKSRGEEGVLEAEEFCADQYLERILESAAAHVVVALGGVAKRQIRRVFPLLRNSRVAGPLAISSRERWFVFLPHPNQRGPKKSFAANLGESELWRLQSIARRC